MSFCKVKGCRHPQHLTIVHQCGHCLMLGHGKHECRSKEEQNKLEQYYDDTLEQKNWCTKQHCPVPYTHTTDGHFCIYCGKFENHMKKCPSFDRTYFIEKYNPSSQNYFPDFAIEHIKEIKIGHYAVFYGGQGCQWYVRNNNNKYEIFFMHGDHYGQYGEDTSDLPRLKWFIFEYKMQELTI
jgi:hypothetical protein